MSGNNFENIREYLNIEIKRRIENIASNYDEFSDCYNEDGKLSADVFEIIAGKANNQIDWFIDKAIDKCVNKALEESASNVLAKQAEKKLNIKLDVFQSLQTAWDDHQKDRDNIFSDIFADSLNLTTKININSRCFSARSTGYLSAHYPDYKFLPEHWRYIFEKDIQDNENAKRDIVFNIYAEETPDNKIDCSVMIIFSGINQEDVLFNKTAIIKDYNEAYDFMDSILEDAFKEEHTQFPKM